MNIYEYSWKSVCSNRPNRKARRYCSRFNHRIRYCVQVRPVDYYSRNKSDDEKKKYSILSFLRSTMYVLSSESFERVSICYNTLVQYGNNESMYFTPVEC